VPRPVIGPIDFAENRKFFLLAVVCLAVVGTLVYLIKRGTTGRFLDALRGSEYAAASIGISATRARIIAFSLSAGIAGFGGGLLATYYGSANYDQSFQFFLGLVWVVLVVTAGARSVQAAVVSGLGFFLIPEFLSRLFEIPQRYASNHPDLPSGIASVLNGIKPEWSLGVAFILFGFGALTYAKHPEGIIEAQTSASIRRMTRRRNRRHDDTASTTGTSDAGGTAGREGDGRGDDAAGRPTTVEPGPAGVR
jgi:branched-chain amino acid transport system permease protein